MPIFEKPPLETLTPAKDRWTPIYLEHGRLEVDDSSIKRNAASIGLLIVSSYPNCQGFKIETTGPTDRRGIEVAGLWMVAEKWEESPDPPTQASNVSPGNLS